MNDNFEKQPEFENLMPEQFYFNECHDSFGVKTDHKLYETLHVHDYCQQQLQPQLFPQDIPPNTFPVNDLAQTNLGYFPETTNVVQYPYQQSLESDPDHERSVNLLKRNSSKALNIVHWTAEMVGWFYFMIKKQSILHNYLK
jgi:hypothetical protein